MKQHVSRVESASGSCLHYLVVTSTIRAKIYQLNSISSKIPQAIVKEIETSKYFSIILD